MNGDDLIRDLDIELGLKNVQKIHIRIQQRNGKKSVTVIENLTGSDSKLDLNFILKTLKDFMHCGGSIKETEGGNVIILNGDQRSNIKTFLVSNHIANKNDVIVHGF